MLHLIVLDIRSDRPSQGVVAVCSYSLCTSWSMRVMRYSPLTYFPGQKTVWNGVFLR